MMKQLIIIGCLLASFNSSAQFVAPPDGHVCVAINVLENYVTYYKPTLINDTTCLGVANARLLDTVVWPIEDSVLLQSESEYSDNFYLSHANLNADLTEFIAEIESVKGYIVIFGSICQTGYPNTKRRSVVTFSPLIFDRWLFAKVEAFNSEGEMKDYFYLRVEFDPLGNLVGYKLLE